MSSNKQTKNTQQQQNESQLAPQNPAQMVKTQKIITKVEFAEKQSKTEKSNGEK